MAVNTLSGARSGEWSGKTLLIVDDSTLIVDALQKVYEQLGLRIVGTANDGLRAMEKFHELKPDLVSLDVIMPDIHGIECFRRMRAAVPEQKILFVSALTGEPGVAEGLNEKIDLNLFVGKPLNEEILKARLNYIWGVKSIPDIAVAEAPPPPKPPKEDTEPPVAV